MNSTRESKCKNNADDVLAHTTSHTYHLSQPHPIDVCCGVTGISTAQASEEKNTAVPNFSLCRRFAQEAPESQDLVQILQGFTQKAHQGHVFCGLAACGRYKWCLCLSVSIKAPIAPPSPPRPLHSSWPVLPRGRLSSNTFIPHQGLLWRSPTQGSIQRLLHTLVLTHKHVYPEALFSSSASPRPCRTLTSAEDLTPNSTPPSPQTTPKTVWRILCLFLNKPKFPLPQSCSHTPVLGQLAQMNSYIHNHVCSLSLLPVQED